MLSFGQRLKLLRNEADISQSDLADALGVSAQSVSKWECDLYCPDVTLLLPLAGVLGVTTDCLLGAGSNEKEDREELIKEIKAIQDGPCGEGAHGRKSYRIAGLIDEFLKKYPLNYEMRLKYADWVHLYLHSGIVRGIYEIPESEFEELWSKGFKMANSVKNHDNDPTRLNETRFIMIAYYDLKGEYDKAESIAAELPEYQVTKLDALYDIARVSRDFEKAEKLSVAEAIESYDDCSWFMWERARRISIFGQVRKEEAIAAWLDALKCALEYDRVFGKSWPYTELKEIIECKNHPKIIASNIYFGLIGDLLSLERTSEALDALEELTKLGEELYGEKKELLAAGSIDQKEFNESLEMIKEFPLHSYNSVIQDDDNFFTREERYKACKARLDALE